MFVRKIVCDNCYSVGNTAVTDHAHVLREMLRGMGWSVGLPGGKDFCPACRIKPKTSNQSGEKRSDPVE